MPRKDVLYEQIVNTSPGMSKRNITFMITAAALRYPDEIKHWHKGESSGPSGWFHQTRTVSGATAVELCPYLAPISHLAAGVHMQLDRVQMILDIGVSHKEHGRTLCTDIHILKTLLSWNCLVWTRAWDSSFRQEGSDKGNDLVLGRTHV